MKIRNLVPKVLIVAPVSQRHEHVLDEWIEHLNSLTYPNFDVCLCDTTPDTDRYYKKLKKIKVKGKHIKVLRHKWDYKKWQAVQWLAFSREKIRQYFLKNNYDYAMNLDDDIFLPKNGIQRLLSYHKDNVGFYVHVYSNPNHKPCVLKNGEMFIHKGLDYFTFAEITAYNKFSKKYRKKELTKEEKLMVPFIIEDPKHPNLFKTYGVGLGCLLSSRKVVENVPFRTHHQFVQGEDLWFFSEANDKKFELWCDSDTRCVHKNTGWSGVIKKGPKSNGNLFIAFGPNESDKVTIVDRSKK
jgi:hypothetical protein